MKSPPAAVSDLDGQAYQTRVASHTTNPDGRIGISAYRTLPLGFWQNSYPLNNPFTQSFPVTGVMAASLIFP
jgi:hypothetical protein